MQRPKIAPEECPNPDVMIFRIDAKLPRVTDTRDDPDALMRIRDKDRCLFQRLLEIPGVEGLTTVGSRYAIQMAKGRVYDWAEIQVEVQRIYLEWRETAGRPAEPAVLKG